MTDRVTVNIDLERLKDIAHTGVRRAILFMGLGLNAMHREDVRDYRLHKLPLHPGQTSIPVDFFPADLPLERVNEFKREFSVWLTGCGLREMLEHYALFVDHIHKYGLVVLQSRDLLNGLDPEKAHRAFHKNGSLAEKLRLLEERFDIAPKEGNAIVQLYTARNCLTHSLGIVGPKHCDDRGSFVVAWAAFDTIAVGEDTGAEVPVADLIRSGKPTTEPMSILIRGARRERKFKAGEKLHFSQQDLWELCHYFAAEAIPSTLASFLAFLKAHKIPVIENQGEMPKCKACSDVGWVCESHPDRPWDKNLPRGCECDAGIPCPACNVPEADEAPRLPPGMRVSFDKDGSRH